MRIDVIGTNVVVGEKCGRLCLSGNDIKEKGQKDVFLSVINLDNQRNNRFSCFCLKKVVWIQW